MSAHVSQRSIDSMLGGTISAMVLISFILIFIFRSIRIGLLSLVPNFIPAIMSFGRHQHLIAEAPASSRRVLKAEMRAGTNDEIMPAWCWQTGD